MCDGIRELPVHVFCRQCGWRGERSGSESKPCPYCKIESVVSGFLPRYEALLMRERFEMDRFIENTELLAEK